MTQRPLKRVGDLFTAEGWHVGRLGGRREIDHLGQQPSVSNVLDIRPETHVAVPILCNLDGVRVIALARQVADILEATR